MIYIGALEQSGAGHHNKSVKKKQQLRIGCSHETTTKTAPS